MPAMRTLTVLLPLILGGTVLAGLAHATDDTQQTTCPGQRRALLLSGGGVRGAYQLGALALLVKKLNCTFDHFIGTSTGAVTAAVLSQATNHSDLEARIDFLLKRYSDLRSKDDIIREKFLGKLRLFLPAWLGGTDGIASLAPLEKDLRALVIPDITPENLTIPVVSLQSGRMHSSVFRPDSFYDLVLGSASIPVAVETRRARFWALGSAAALNGSVLHVTHRQLPGLADPDCRLRLGDDQHTIRCRQLDSTIQVFQPNVVRVNTALDLPDLSPLDRKRLQDFFSLNPRPSIAFTTYHQLIDGGVTDNIPLRDAIRELERKRIDTVFLLLTGWSVVGRAEQSQMRGVLAVLEASFEILWDSYQESAFDANLSEIELRRLVCALHRDANSTRRHGEAATKAWRLEAERYLSPSRVQEIETALRERAPKLEWNHDIEQTFVNAPIYFCLGHHATTWKLIIVNVRLVKSLLGPLEVDPPKINQAIRAGCEAAARQIARDYRRDVTGWRQFCGSLAPDRSPAASTTLFEPHTVRDSLHKESETTSP